MYSTETEIQDQAYQFFKQEAPEFLQIIETGLLSLREDRSTANIHAIMRAAHSIKGGSASLNLDGIKTIAHQLEDVFRSLYRFEGEIDSDVEGLLFQAYDCLRLPLMDQLQSGHYEAASAIAEAEPVFEVLKLYLGDTDEDVELPTAAELGVDIVQVVFEGDVQQGISRLQNVLAHPEGVPVTGEIRAQIEVFSGIGELLNLSGFKAIAQATLQALENCPDNPILVGKVAVANFEAAREQVLAGDRAQGGQPSPELLNLAQANQFQSEAIATTLTEEPFQLDFEEPDDWFQSLELEIGDLNFSNLESNLESELSTDKAFTDSTLENLDSDYKDLDVLTKSSPDNFADFDHTSSVSNSELTLDTPENKVTGSLNLDTLDDQIDQEFEIFADHSGNENDHLKSNVFEDFHSLDSIFGSVDFDVDNTLEHTVAEISSVEPSEIQPSQIQPSQIQPKQLLSPDQKTNQNLLNPTSKSVTKTPTKTAENIAPYISETVKVDLPRLERLNNFSSELVTQENASILQNQQLQAKIERLQKQFKGFEKLSKSLQTWLDKAQRSQVRAPEISSFLSNLSTNLSTSANLLADFDPLQMDSYNHLYNVIQESLEEIAQIDEGMRDMTVLMQQTQQTQRRKHQILKQVRYDLLWSRMLPLSDILSSLPRMVRELSNKYNKQVNLKLLGTSTLVDKSVLEKLYDPFVHLVRNAFDHGTDSTQDRLERGKPVIASIEIRAYYRGNQTYIEIKDDGHGINVEKVKEKAIAVGLLEPEQADQITNEEVYQFLFAPSFSTAETVSELSGRGMGLSTVQEQVRSLKGSIDIKSVLGQGTVFTIKLPLTLSIAKLMIFSIQERLLAIAIDTLLGIVTVDSSEIQIIQGKEFYRFEDRLIPLYPISIFADGYPLPKQSLDIFSTESFTEENQTTMLLFSDGSEIVALPIDRVLNEQELAVKPFGKAIAPPPYLYGCTILGDGTLVPVIDSAALISMPQSSIKSPVTDKAHVPSKPTVLEVKSLQRPTILIVDDSLTTRQALYLTLEKFGYQIVQASDGREAIDKLARSPEIQAVLCDVEMPNMNGFEFLAACRKDLRHKALPIVMVTSRGGQKHRGVAQVLGASGYITKPYLEQDLIKTIQDLLV